MNLNLLEIPYYAVIFQAKIKSYRVESAYINMSKQIRDLAKNQNGFLGFESAENTDGEISIWKTWNDIKNWKQNKLHIQAQKLGKESWYENYVVRICKVEREYKF